MEDKFEGIKPIAMKCDESQFNSILPRLKELGYKIENLKWSVLSPSSSLRQSISCNTSYYITNNLRGKLGEIGLVDVLDDNIIRGIHDTWDEQIFLEYCTPFKIKFKIKDMDNLKISKEKVLEAASQCPTAKEILKTLFPEVFVEDKSIDLSSFSNKLIIPDMLSIRLDGEFENKAYCLTNKYNWELKKDKYGVLCLIPTKK